MNQEQTLKAFDGIVMRAGEMFSDYVFLARVEGGGFISRASDHSWAIGACERYINNIKTEDAVEIKEFRKKE